MGCRLASHLFLFIQICLLLCVLCLVVPAHALTPIDGFNPASLTQYGNGVFLDARSFWADNALSLNAIFYDKWRGPFHPSDQNHLDVFWKTDAGVIYRGWRLAAFYRGELFVDANRDSIEIIRMISLKQDLPAGKKFDIDIKTKGFSATGMEVSKGFRAGSTGLLKNLDFGLTARYMRGEKVQDGSLVGSALPTGPKVYDFDIQIDYVYDYNLAYRRKNITAGTGDGFSFDLGLRYAFNEAARADILFRDIMGRIYWKNVPYTSADAVSATKYFDPDGYMAFRPTIRGYEGYKDFTQKLPLKTDISLTYIKDSFTIVPSLNFIEKRPLYWIDIGYKASKDLSFNASCNFNYRSFSVGTSYQKARLAVYADNLSLKKAAAAGVDFRIIYEW